MSHSTLSTLPTRSRKMMAPSRGITATVRNHQGLHVTQVRLALSIHGRCPGVSS
jgi:hypothetical protein